MPSQFVTMRFCLLRHPIEITPEACEHILKMGSVGKQR